METKKPRGKPGRPDMGITDTYKQIFVTLSPEMLGELDRVVDRRELRTGKKTSRLDIIREALSQYLEQV